MQSKGGDDMEKFVDGNGKEIVVGPYPRAVNTEEGGVGLKSLMALPERKQILTVDFDIIMDPCIKLYNKDINAHENDRVIWESLERMYNIDKHLSYDSNILLGIERVMLLALLNGATFKAIRNHDEILEDDDFKMWNEQNCLFDITNVDYHHDLGYTEEGEARALDQDVYDCTDWAGYLYHRGKLGRYDWVKAKSSDIPPKDVFKHSLVIQRFNDFIQQYTGDNGNPPKEVCFFDKVYFALSPQWVPYKYHHLYHMIRISCQDFNRINLLRSDKFDQYINGGQ